MTELRTLRWGDYTGLSKWIQRNHKDPCKRKAEGPQAEKQVTAEGKRQKKGLEDVNTTSFEAGWWGHKPKYTRGFLKLEK